MGNKKKRLMLGSLLFIGMCFAAMKMDVVQVAHAKVVDAMNDTKTIHYNEDNRNNKGRAVVSPDRTHLSFCKGTKEFFVQDLSTGKITTYSTEEVIYQLKYSPNGTYLAAGRNVLNTKTGKVTQLATDATMTSTFDYIAFSPNSEKLAIVNEEHAQNRRPTIIEIWNLEAEQLVQKLSCGNMIHQMAFSKEGDWLAVTADKITIWDIQTATLVKSLVTDSMPADNEIRWHINYEAISYSPDGKHLAAVLESTYDSHNESQKDQARRTEVIEIWDTVQGVVVKTLQLDNHLNVEQIQYSPDGKYLASANVVSSEDKIRDAVLIWDVNQGLVVKRLTQFPDDSDVTGTDYSADGNYLSASGHWNTRIWKIK